MSEMTKKRGRGKAKRVSRVTLDYIGNPVIIELRRDGLAIRRKYARKSKETLVDFATLCDVANGQATLPLVIVKGKP